MTARVPREYRFATSEQWGACVLHRFETTAAIQAPVARLGHRALRLAIGGPLSIVAVDPHGASSWRRDPSPQGPGGLVREEVGTVQGPLEVDAVLALSPRWVADRRWLWAFDQKAPVLHRWDRETLQRDLSIDLREVGPAAGRSALEDPLAILDIARDGREGVWVLVRGGGRGERLEHVDCEGRRRGGHPVPCEAGSPRELGSVGGRKLKLVLLASDGLRLAILDPQTGSLSRTVPLGMVAPCWSAARLATDTRNRIALWGGAAPGSLVLLDGTGDTLDGPLAGFFPGPEPLDLAVRGDVVWFATREGAFCLDTSEACTARETDSALLTPRLESPERDSLRGWLRAEIRLDLPDGAVLEAEFTSTNDGREAERLHTLASDLSVPAARRQAGFWAAAERRPERLFRIVGPVARARPVAVPLFASRDRWLWLGLRLVIPPASPAAKLAELRVLYPDASLSKHVPAIFRGETNDPGGFLRRLVGVLEVTTQGIDERIRAIGAHVHPDTAPDDWLDSLGRWLELPWEDALPSPAKRRLLQNAGDLIARRGTRDGLRLLLECLLGEDGVASIADLTVDHPPVVLGGRSCPGSSLPALLAGADPRAATLGGKAVLGRARVACGPADCDPLRTIRPTARIDVVATRGTSGVLEPLLARILRQYLPAGVGLVVRWRIAATQRADRTALVLDESGPGALGADATIGRTVLGGRRRGSRIDDGRLEVGFHLA